MSLLVLSEVSWFLVLVKFHAFCPSFLQFFFNILVLVRFYIFSLSLTFPLSTLWLLCSSSLQLFISGSREVLYSLFHLPSVLGSSSSFHQFFIPGSRKVLQILSLSLFLQYFCFSCFFLFSSFSSLVLVRFCVLSLTLPLSTL